VCVSVVCERERERERERREREGFTHAYLRVILCCAMSFSSSLDLAASTAFCAAATSVAAVCAAPLASLMSAMPLDTVLLALAISDSYCRR
jgi:hypothetical protein